LRREEIGRAHVCSSDLNSSGIIIMTNDGDITFKLTHPAHEIDKIYMVRINGTPSESDIQKLRDGVEIDGAVTFPALVNKISRENNNTLLKVAIHEGRNRQVRKMFASIGYEVLVLRRIAIGNLKLDNLKLGEWRFLNSHEIEYLKNL
jgi:23S rRNA pseudouridine2605 synthase